MCLHQLIGTASLEVFRCLQINFTGYVKDMSVDQWATMHVENATSAFFNNFTWQNNTGALPHISFKRGA